MKGALIPQLSLLHTEDLSQFLRNEDFRTSPFNDSDSNVLQLVDSKLSQPVQQIIRILWCC